MEDKDFDNRKYYMFILIVLFFISSIIGIMLYNVSNDRVIIYENETKVEIDSLIEKKQEIKEEIKQLDSIKNVRIEEVKNLDNDSTLKLFYELIRE